MSAPLPLRFYNPVKGLCKKANLDYDTVIASTLTNKTIIDAFINSEMKKPLEEQRFEDRQNLKKQKEFYDKKYGARVSGEGAGSGDAEDTGRIRYDLGITVEHLLPDDSKVDESATAPDRSETLVDSKFTKEAIKHIRPKQCWIPGRPDSVKSE
jgi:hypothetical protein